MGDSYSLYDAKARLSELIRMVRDGHTIAITYHGKRVALLTPATEGTKETFQQRLERLEGEGTTSGAPKNRPRFSPIAKRVGGLKRFLEERE